MSILKKTKMSLNPKDIFFGYYFVLTLILFALNSNAQFLDTIVSSLQHKPRIDARFDTRGAFVANRAATILGIKLGFDFNKTVKMGIGYNWLSSNIVKINKLNTEKVFFSYVSPYIEYTYYKHNKWELSIPVQIGIGLTHAENKILKNKTEKKLVLMYEPSMTGQYKFVKWFGIGAGLGYRLVIVGNNALGKSLTSPIYIIKAKLFLGELIRGK